MATMPNHIKGTNHLFAEMRKALNLQEGDRLPSTQ